MRIVVLADSMAMPRVEEGCTIYWDDTWAQRLQQLLRAAGETAEVINCAARNRTADTLVGLDFLEHVVWKQPDVVIVQVGVVDGAPRVFSRRERAILDWRFFPAGVRTRLVASRSKRRAALIRRNPLAKVYTPPADFARFIRQFIERAARHDPRLRILVLPISANMAQMEVKSPGYAGNLKLYNAALERCCQETGARWVTPEELTGAPEGADLFCADGYHYNEAGNRRIAAALKKILGEPPPPSHPKENGHDSNPTH
jgi:lysophospholipase L1-like esterase